MEFLAKAIFLLNVAVFSQAGLPHAPPPVASKPSPLLAPQHAPSSEYGFRYAVNDFKGNEHSHQQRRMGNAVTGQYKVLLPDGRLQTVTYIADENGYRAKVEYSPARPGEATTAGLGTPPIAPHQPPPLPPPPILPMPLPGFVPPFAAQRKGSDPAGNGPSLRQTQDQNGNGEREDVIPVDVEQIDVPGPDAPVVQRSARRLGSLASEPSPVGRAGSSQDFQSNGSNKRADRIRFNTAYVRRPNSSYQQQSPYTWASRFAY